MVFIQILVLCMELSFCWSDLLYALRARENQFQVNTHKLSSMKEPQAIYSELFMFFVTGLCFLLPSMWCVLPFELFNWRILVYVYSYHERKCVFRVVGPHAHWHPHNTTPKKCTNAWLIDGIIDYLPCILFTYEYCDFGWTVARLVLFILFYLSCVLTQKRRKGGSRMLVKHTRIAAFVVYFFLGWLITDCHLNGFRYGIKEHEYLFMACHFVHSFLLDIADIFVRSAGRVISRLQNELSMSIHCVGSIHKSIYKN